METSNYTLRTASGNRNSIKLALDIFFEKDRETSAILLLLYLFKEGLLLVSRNEIFHPEYQLAYMPPYTLSVDGKEFFREDDEQYLEAVIEDEQLEHLFQIFVQEYNNNGAEVQSSTLYDVYKHLVDIDKEWFDENFIEIFDEALARCRRHNYQSDFSQPAEITKLVAAIADYKSGIVYNPFSGIASYATEIKACNNYYGQELNQLVWAIGMLRLLASGIDAAHFQNGDSIYDWQYDVTPSLIVSTPPFGINIRHLDLDSNKRSIGIPDRGTYEEFLLKVGYDCLPNDGKLIAVVPQGMLFRRGSFPSEAIGDLETVIQLPAKLFETTNISTAIIVLHKGIGRNSTKMVNGTNYFVADRQRNILQWEDLYEAIQNNDNSVVKDVPTEDIVDNDYKLMPTFYLSNPDDEIDIPKGCHLARLGELVEPYPNVRFETGKVRFVRGKDLSSNSLDAHKTFIDLPEEELNQRGCVLVEDALLILKVGQIKPTHFIKTAGVDIVANSNIAVYRFGKGVFPEYLTSELGKYYVTAQYDAHSVGDTIPHISTRDLLDIRVIIPDDLSQQEILYEAEIRSAKFAKAKELGLEDVIAKMKAEYVDEIRMRKHDMKTPLRDARYAFQNMEELLSKSSIGIEEKDAISIEMESCRTAITNLSRMVDNLLDETVFGEPATIRIQDILDDFYAYIAQYSDNVSPEFTVTGDLDLSDDRSGHIHINYDDFDRVLKNIFSNANTHGFSDPKAHYKFNIILGLTPDRKSYQLDLVNNGEPLPSGMNKERFGIRGEKGAASKGDGLGGNIVKRIIEHFGGDYDIFSNEGWTVVRLILPIYHDDDAETL